MFEATLHIPMEKSGTVKRRILELVGQSGFTQLPERGPFKDGHLEIVAVDKKKTDMLKFKLDPKAKLKTEAQRAGIELNVFPASKGFYLYLTVRPYMELRDAPEIPGVTADEVEQRTDEKLCRQVFISFLPKLEDALDAEIVAKHMPVASKTRKKTLKVKRSTDAYEPDFEIILDEKNELRIASAKEEAVECRIKYEELNKEMEMMRMVGQKEKERCADQYFSAFVLDMGEVVDNLERALADPTLGPDHAKGLDMIRRQFLSTLENYNVVLIDPRPGEEYDVHKHEGLSTRKDDKFPQDSVVEVIRKGYSYKGSVIRPAQVITAK